MTELSQADLETAGKHTASRIDHIPQGYSVSLSLGDNETSLLTG